VPTEICTRSPCGPRQRRRSASATFPYHSEVTPPRLIREWVRPSCTRRLHLHRKQPARPPGRGADLLATKTIYERHHGRGGGDGTIGLNGLGRASARVTQASTTSRSGAQAKNRGRELPGWMAAVCARWDQGIPNRWHPMTNLPNRQNALGRASATCALP